MRCSVVNRNIIYALLILLIFYGCAKKVQPTVSDAYLLKEGIDYYNRGKYKKSAELFEQAIRYSETPDLAAKAQHYLAESYFNDGNYAEAISSYEQYINIYPHAEDAGTSIYRIAISHYNEISDIDRGQRATKEALNNFNKLKMQYPIIYKEKKVDRIIQELREILASNELYIANFYFRTKEYKAGEKRLLDILDAYKGTDIYVEALIGYCEYVSKEGKVEDEAINCADELLRNRSAHPGKINALLEKIKKYNL